MPKNTSKSKTKKLIFIFLLITFFLVQNNYISINRIIIKDLKKMPKHDTFKIVHLSDLHNKSFYTGQKPLIKKIVKEKPDMIVITGDLIDYKSKQFKPVEDLLKGIEPLAPIYFVNGNHEAHNKNYGQLLKLFDQYHVTIMNDDATMFKDKNMNLRMIGLNDPEFSDVPVGYIDLNRRFNLSEKNFNILLSHRPELFSYYASHDIDLVLSGHAHGGQFRIPFLNQGIIAPNQGFFPKYTKGSYHRNDTTMVVSAGLGNSIIPFRIFNLPELVVIELVNEK